MFQAEAGSGNTASVSSTRTVISDTPATYAISDEQGGRKKVLDNALPDAAGVFFYTPRYLFEPSVRVPSLWPMCLVLKLLRNIRPGFQFLGWHNGCATFGGI